MSRKTTILGLAAAAVLAGSALTASAAPTAVLGLNLYEADGTTPIVAGGDGIYHLTPGQIFTVVLTANVTTPNLTNAGRATNVRNKPLGIGNLSVSLVTSAPLSADLGGGPIGLVVPGVDNPTPPGSQENGSSYNVLLTTGSVNFPDFVNLGDAGGDGDRDVNGTGFGVNPGIPNATNTNAQFAVGVNGPVELVSHKFVANAGAGVVNLHTNVSTLNFFADPNTSGALVSQAAQSTSTGTNPAFGTWSDASVLIQVPEPATLGLLATGGLALVARRRRA